MFRYIKELLSKVMPLEEQMKIPYGLTDLKTIITDGYVYCDRTDKIPFLETARSQLFFRPKGFGKSLLLSMLANYYDVAAKDSFKQVFGGLSIGKNPTALKSSFVILALNFSCVDSLGSAEITQNSLSQHVNARIKRAVSLYREKKIDLNHVRIHEKNPLASLESFVTAASIAGYPVYLLIDEYDDFVRTCFLNSHTKEKDWSALVRGQSVLKPLLETMKALASEAMFDRVFITGMWPFVLDEIACGSFGAVDISFEPEHNDLCGFREEEVQSMIANMVHSGHLDEETADEALDVIKISYKGHRFVIGEGEIIYNPSLCLYFLDSLDKKSALPCKIFEYGFYAFEAAKLASLTKSTLGKGFLMSMIQKENELTIGDIHSSLSLSRMLTDKTMDKACMASLLYYCGALTLDRQSPEGEVLVKVPNLVMQNLFVEQVKDMLLPEAAQRDRGLFCAKQVYQRGDIGPLSIFVQGTLFQIFKNREYKWANELTLKTAFLTLLYNDLLFIMDAEPDVERKYGDLTMIIRPDKRHFKIYDCLVAFQFVPLKDAGLDSEQARSLPELELYAWPEIQKAFKAGQKQVMEYKLKLESRYKHLKLRQFVVVSLGFERICYKNGSDWIAGALKSERAPL